LKFSLFAVKKIFLLTTLLHTLILTQVSSADASPDTTISVEPYASTARIGGTFTINITLTDVQNLFGLEVALHWDASILQMVYADVSLGVESYPDGVLHNPVWKNETMEEGKYMLVGMSTGRDTPSFDGGGNVVRITFNVTDRGNTKLRLETKLADKPQPGGVASPIAHTTFSGAFSPIHIFISSATVTVGENLNISGFIALAQADVSVTIQYRREGETDWHTLSTIKTNEEGDYGGVWQPPEGEKYEIRATALIDNVEETSYSVYLTVKAFAQTSIWQYVTIFIVLVVGIVAIIMYSKSIKKRIKWKKANTTPPKRLSYRKCSCLSLLLALL